MSNAETNIVSLMSQVETRLDQSRPSQREDLGATGAANRVPSEDSIEVAARVMAQISSALALIQAIDYGELLAVPPDDEAERKRHRTALAMIDLIEQELVGALGSLKRVVDKA